MKLTEEIKQSILKESKNMRELNLLMNRSKTSSAEENYTGRKKIPLLIRLKYTVTLVYHSAASTKPCTIIWTIYVHLKKGLRLSYLITKNTNTKNSKKLLQNGD